MLRVRPSAAALALLVACAGAGIVATARADLSDLKGTKPGDLANGGFFVDADTCGNCHAGLDNTFLPFDTWAGTMMANSVRDPIFFAGLAIANQDSAELGSKLCLRCHSPLGYVRGHAVPNDGSALDATDLQGVGCDTCHRMTQSPAPDDPYVLGDAQIVYDDNQGKRGKYDDALAPAHETVPDLGVNEARFCGQCHQVTNPTKNLLDETGADTGIPFPFETTFEEWQNSAFSVEGSPDAKTCQECHMVAKIGNWPLVQNAGAPLRKDPRMHTFVGGNHFGIRAVMEANPERAAMFPEPFANALQATLDNLATAVSVSLVSAPTTLDPGATFDVTVRVQNETGHKFPTGYVDARQAWIAVALVDCDGNETLLVGGYDVATGQVQANPPTHVYKAVHGRWDGTKGVEEMSMAKQDIHLSDTRIPPKGFTATPATLPSKEVDYSDGQGGWKSFDEVTFSLTAPATLHGPQRLSARVMFQEMRRDFVEYLRDANTTNSKGDELWDIYTKLGEAKPHVIAAAEQVYGGECPTGTGGGGSGGGEGGEGGKSAGSGGAPSGAGGSGGSAGGEPGGDDGGCGCRMAGASGPESGLAKATLALGLGLLCGRRGGRRAREGRSCKAAP
jgi:hypothetical protein